MEIVHQDKFKYVSNSALFYRSETFIIKIEAAIETDQVTIKSQPGVKIKRALGPMACKIAYRPSKLTLSGPAGPANFEAIVIQL